MGLGDIVDDKKNDTESKSDTGSSSSSSSSSSSTGKEDPEYSLFKEVKNFDPETDGVPICPKCKTEGEQATDPSNGDDLYYYRCTTHYDECDVLQYVYSTRKERYVHKESDPMQKKIIQESEDEEDEEEDDDEPKKESTMEEWEDFLDGVTLE